MAWRIAGWFVRSVGIALIPVGMNLLVTKMFQQPANFATLFGRGELLLLSFALLLGVSGDIIGMRPGLDKAKRAALGICVAVVLVIGLVYFPAAYPKLLAKPPDASVLGMVSLGLYIFALVASLTSLYAAKESGNV